MIFENPVVILLACYWLVVTKHGFLLVFIGRYWNVSHAYEAGMLCHHTCLILVMNSFFKHYHTPTQPHNTIFIFLGKLEQGLYLNHNKKRKIQWMVGNWPRSCKRSDALFQKSLLLFSTRREYFYRQPTHFFSQPKK